MIQGRGSVGAIITLFLVLPIGLAACGHRGPVAANQTAPTLAGDAAHPGSTAGWVRTELYFGLGLADAPEGSQGKGISESEWREFLDSEVTPRFPAGLSVEDVYGQWLGKGKTAPSRLRSKVIVILYPGTAENARKIGEIRAAWKQKTGDQSVLRVTEPVDVSF